MKIYTYYQCNQTNDNLVSILENNLGFTAITLSQSKTFKTFNKAKEFLAKRGYKKIIKEESIK